LPVLQQDSAEMRKHTALICIIQVLPTPQQLFCVKNPVYVFPAESIRAFSVFIYYSDVVYFFVPLHTFSGVIGSSLCHVPVALNTACAIAGEGVLITISPMDFAPNGPVGSQLDSKNTLIRLISTRAGTLYCIKEFSIILPLSV